MGVWLKHPPSLHLAQGEPQEVEEDLPMPNAESSGPFLSMVDTRVVYETKFITGGIILPIITFMHII